ncbi:MAG: LytTR family DNA-binding domain-containing protein [Gemmatimonadaceae bacterium]
MNDELTRMRVLVVDDEPLARERLRRLLVVEPDVVLVGLCPDGDAAIDAVRVAAPDLIFLDIQMPGRDGFAVVEVLLQELPVERIPVIVFATAHDSFAVRAFEAHALDYLVKPFDDDRFAAALGRARVTVRRSRMDLVGAQLRRLLSSPGSPAPHQSEPTEVASAEGRGGRLDRIVLRTGDRARVLRAEAIDWIGADSVYARLHIGRSSYLIRTPMHELEARLDPQRFVRIHRSTIVNLDRVRELHEVDRGEVIVVLEDGTRLKVSRNRRLQLEDRLGHVL